MKGISQRDNTVLDHKFIEPTIAQIDSPPSAFALNTSPFFTTQQVEFVSVEDTTLDDIDNAVSSGKNNNNTIQGLVPSKTKRKKTALLLVVMVSLIITLIFVACVGMGCMVGISLFFTVSESQKQALQHSLMDVGVLGKQHLVSILENAIHDMLVVNTMISIHGSSKIANTSIAYCETCTLGSHAITPEQFYSFIAYSNTAIPTFSLRYCPRIKHEFRKNFETTAQRFLPNFFIAEETVSSIRRNQSEYYPVLYFYPDVTLGGVDMLASPDGFEKIAKAELTRSLVATSRFKLFHDVNSHYYGVHLYSPIFKLIPNQTVSNTNFIFTKETEEIVGVITGIFNLSLLAENSFQNVLQQQVDVVMIDETEGTDESTQFLHSTKPSDFSTPISSIFSRFQQQPLQFQISFPVADRIWSLYFFPRIDYFQGHSNDTLSLLLSMGLSLFIATILSFIFCIIVYSVVLTCITKERTKLLFKMLPEAIVKRISNGNGMIADRLSDVSVLFADLVGFTALSTTLPVTKLVAILNELFCEFDSHLMQFQIEKIKTIGDCYMACSGLDQKNTKAAAIRMGYFALKLLELIEYCNQTLPSHQQLALRIGIANGECIAGILGKERPMYDIWGECVNLASRMESTGVSKRIQVSAAFKQLVEEYFEWEARGVIEIKGKGPVETWFLVKAKEDFEKEFC